MSEVNDPRLESAAIYIRVSTIDQARDGFSLAAQERTLRAYCEAKGYSVYGVYADEGCSGKSIEGRDELKRLVEDGMQGKYTKILIWKLSRFARNVADFMTICAVLEKRDIYIESVSEAFDSKTSTGRLLRGIIAVIAQWEREVIGDNVKVAMSERAIQGKRTCSFVLGYDKCGSDTLTVNEKEAAIVRRIYDWYLEYKNISTVTRMCSTYDYKGKAGATIRSEGIHRVLTRPIYCGYYTFGGAIYEGSHPSIISIEKYNRVQEIMKARSLAVGRKRKTKLITLQPRNHI